MTTSYAPSGYTHLPPSASTVAGWHPGMEYGMATPTIHQQRQQGLQQAGAARHQGGAPQPRPHQPGWQNPRAAGGGPPGANRGAAAAGQQVPLDGGLEMPPPPDPNANCHHCGRTTHHPLPCGVKYPHLAPFHVRAPDPNGPRQDLHQMFEEGRRRMPPGMPVGGKLAAWLQRYRQQLSVDHQRRVQGYIDQFQAGQGHQARMARDFYQDYGLVSTVDLDGDHVPATQLFFNQAPPQFQQPGARSLISIPHGGWTEHAAAFPVSFLQTGVQTRAAQPAHQPKQQVSQPPTAPAESLQQLVEQMKDCLQRAETALAAAA